MLVNAKLFLINGIFHNTIIQYTIKMKYNYYMSMNILYKSYS